ncbi:GDSL-like Lipase/Acylhydrolase superfamily protein [Tasmannia lanceolata]|uniref:GDSL-like Lipase/Acylhydrolase superfamily protein n=1 Tax=Tasmannia lanceolata TaxID=3420 RepID=UPI00406428D0
MLRPMFSVVVVVVVMVLQHTRAFDIREMRQLAARNNVTSVLVFGDSTVDPGNNNHLPTTFKSNFPPYGKDFFGGHSTGRFTNGRLPTDFIGDALGVTGIIPAFLDRSLKKEQLLHGVSFASAASGYDNLTADVTKVLRISRQIEYLRHYKIHLRELVGEKRGEEIVRNAIFIVSAGTNDFIQNYFVEPERSKQFSVERYIDYLMNCLAKDIEDMQRLGGRRFVVVGVPPMGCLPLIKTLNDATDCADNLNQVSITFNSKLKAKLITLKKLLGVKICYADCFGPLLDAMKQPMKYGFTETSKGCCGTGTTEFGESCRGLNICADPTKYVYWDAVHPTEKMYKFIAYEVLKAVSVEMFR